MLATTVNFKYNMITDNKLITCDKICVVYVHDRADVITNYFVVLSYMITGELITVIW